MEPTSNLPNLPFRKTLREGQQRLIRLIDEQKCKSINIQLPTGYGKTLAAICAYSRLKQLGKVDRLLYIVPTVAQLNQFVSDAGHDMRDAGVIGPLGIWRIDYSPSMAISHHRKNEQQVFACTVQGMTNGRGAMWDAIADMLSTSRWMIVIDEYHHYGIDAHWGRKTLELPCTFRLAMSATPYRKYDDSAFGSPDIIVTYRDALLEGCVKILQCHSYIYRIDAKMENGDIRTFTTDELVKEAGSDSPEAIDRMRIERRMRWSPKYVSPLVDLPLARLQRERLETGLPLQMIVGTMCCSHAELVCEQIHGMFPEYRTDWVGTGEFGRTPEDNRKIISKFCPEKKNGIRRPEDIELDILVHVAMAGEGLDSVFVTEVVHLNPANINNQNNQENGRASRVMPGAEPGNQKAFINVDSSSPYAQFTGEAIMDLMDNQEAIPIEESDSNSLDGNEDGVDVPIPETPFILIQNMELLEIDMGEVKRFAEALIACGIVGVTIKDLDDPNHAIWEKACAGYREMRRKESEQFNPLSTLKQWRDAINNATSHASSMAARRLTPKNQRIERSLIGDLKKRITQNAYRLYGSVKDNELDNLKARYDWLQKLDRQIIEKGIPSWLM